MSIILVLYKGIIVYRGLLIVRFGFLLRIIDIAIRGRLTGLTKEKSVEK